MNRIVLLLFMGSVFSLCFGIFFQTELERLKKRISPRRELRSIQFPFLNRPPFRWLLPQAVLLDKLRALGISTVSFLMLEVVGMGAIWGLLLMSSYRVFAPIGALVIYWLLPKGVSILFSQRQRKILREIPAFLDLLRIHLTAGLEILQCLKTLSREFDGPLGEELTRLVAQIEVTGDVHVALTRFADRIDLTEVKVFVEALRHGWDSGLVLDVFESQADVIRIIRRHEITRRTKRLPVLLNVVPVFLVINILLIFLVPLAYQVLTQLASLHP